MSCLVADEVRQESAILRIAQQFVRASVDRIDLEALFGQPIGLTSLSRPFRLPAVLLG
jgi:hypothetical protein